MHPILRLSVISLFVASGWTPSLSAQAAQPASWAKDEAQIRAALQGSADAWNRADLKGHLAIYRANATFMTGTGPRPGVAATEQAFSQQFWREGRPKQMLRFEQAVTHALGADAALQTGRFILSGGGEPEQSGWFTLVWVRTPQGWKVVHDHSS
jgi:ketosteroid isomerase-like protein